MEANDFFRRATLRICGNLEIEAALQRLLSLMSDVMPVTRLNSCVDDRNIHAGSRHSFIPRRIDIAVFSRTIPPVSDIF